MPEATDESEMLTAEEVAAELGVDPSSVRRWIAAGELPATRLPGLRPRYRVKRADVEAWRPRLVKPAG